MAIITFWSNGKEQTGKTMSMAAISTYLAIEHNVKILMISTTDKEETLYNCFFEKTKKRQSMNMYAPKQQGNVANETGMDGLFKMAKSNKVTPQIIRNFTKVIFKETLEALFSSTAEDKGELVEYYPSIIKTAGEYYDYVLVDLDYNINENIQREILKNSDLIIANISQKLSSVDAFLEERTKNPILDSKKTLVLIGRYDKYSKFSAKNIARYIGTRNIPITIPYNTLFYDAAEEAGVPNLFLTFAKNKNPDKDDRNYVFIEEIKRAEDVIQYRLQELQMRY